MDINELARQAVTLLAPYLAVLLGKAAEEVGRRLGGEVYEPAKALWQKLTRKERVRKAAEAAVALPDNPAMQEALRAEIARALEEDAALRAEVAEILQSKVVQRVMAESGSRIEDVEQLARVGPTSQEVTARDQSEIKGIRQIRM